MSWDIFAEQHVQPGQHRVLFLWEVSTFSKPPNFCCQSFLFRGANGPQSECQVFWLQSLQKHTLKQRFKCTQFIWEAIPGTMTDEWRTEMGRPPRGTQTRHRHNQGSFLLRALTQSFATCRAQELRYLYPSSRLLLAEGSSRDGAASPSHPQPAGGMGRRAPAARDALEWRGSSCHWTLGRRTLNR